MVDLWSGCGMRYRKRSITRTFEFLSSQTLDMLHSAICEVFKRDDMMHLYHFAFGSQKPYDSKATTIDCPESCHSRYCTTEVTLGDLNLLPKDTFYYLFDYGDSWWHRIIVLDSHMKPGRGKKYPVLVALKGECPKMYGDIYEEDEDEDV